MALVTSYIPPTNLVWPWNSQLKHKRSFLTQSANSCALRYESSDPIEAEGIQPYKLRGHYLKVGRSTTNHYGNPWGHTRVGTLGNAKTLCQAHSLGGEMMSMGCSCFLPTDLRGSESCDVMRQDLEVVGGSMGKVVGDT